MTDNAQIPPLPRTLRAPEPVIVIGMLAWAISTVVVATTGLGSGHALQICLVGLAVGLLGTAIVLVQRAGVRRGDRGAQQGLD